MNNRSIYIERVLIYYDTIHVFVGLDFLHSHYLCLLFENGLSDKYVAIQISTRRLSYLLSGDIDLREAMTSPEGLNRYYIIVSNQDEFVITDVLDTINEEMLPEAGVFFSSANGSSELLQERIEINKPIIHLGFADRNNSHSIDAESLSQSLNSFQDFISNGYKKISKLKNSKEYTLKVFMTSAASFNVHMYVDSQLDLFGNSEIDKTLSLVDDIFNFIDESDLTSKLLPFKGFAITNYVKFLEVLVKNELSLKYRWTTPNVEMPVRSNFVTLTRLQQALNIITQSTELKIERNVYIGYFLMVDVTNGECKFHILDKGSDIRGKCLDLKLLNGIVVRTTSYTIKTTHKSEQLKVRDKVTEKIIIDEILSE